ncbi:MAG TPA: ATP-binding cassette domain-containing protein, partial [Hyphomicrobiaceae bacterium]|nr:ATP-binding cassette domain-containing protein [Hyphomicrobiaceae bacterium]
MSGPLVEVRGLARTFDVSKPWLNRVIEREERKLLRAVEDVSLEIGAKETFALVGESGSGKSTVAKMIVGLLKPTAGSVAIAGVPMWDQGGRGGSRESGMAAIPGERVGPAPQAGESERRLLRRRIQMIFQDP